MGKDDFKNARESLEEKRENLRRQVRTVQGGSNIHGLVIHGPPGLGKSTLIYEALTTGANKKSDFVYAPLESTAAGQFVFMNKHSDSLIVMDDAHNVLKNPVSLALLKGALWVNPGTRKRTVTWTTKTDSREFEFSGKLIVSVNDQKAFWGEHGDAVGSRVFIHSFDLSFNEKMAGLLEIAEKNHDDLGLKSDDALKIFNIIRKSVNPSSKNMDFRIMAKAAAAYKVYPGSWEKMMSATFEMDERFHLLRQVRIFAEAGSYSTEWSAAAFEHLGRQRGITGCKRSTYFKLQKEWFSDGVDGAEDYLSVDGIVKELEGFVQQDEHKDQSKLT